MPHGRGKARLKHRLRLSPDEFQRGQRAQGRKAIRFFYTRQLHSIDAESLAGRTWHAIIASDPTHTPPRGKKMYRPATSLRLDRHHTFRATCPSGRPRSSSGSTRVGDSLAFMCVTLWSVARLRVLPAVRLCPIAPSLRPSTALLIRGARRHQRLDVNRLHLVRPPLARCRRVLPVAIIDC